ncbi:hypothetical protein BJX99DRAFT_254873 [Aspergillus californicus]
MSYLVVPALGCMRPGLWGNSAGLIIVIPGTSADLWFTACPFIPNFGPRMDYQVVETPLADNNTWAAMESETALGTLQCPF